MNSLKVGLEPAAQEEMLQEKWGNLVQKQTAFNLLESEMKAVQTNSDLGGRDLAWRLYVIV